MSDARIHLDGNIGGPRPGTEQAIDIQASQSGMMYAKFSVATTERKKTQDGSWEDGDTSWWNCTAFGNTAEMVVRDPGQGRPGDLDGKVKIRNYEKDGETQAVGGGDRGQDRAGPVPGQAEEHPVPDPSAVRRVIGTSFLMRILVTGPASGRTRKPCMTPCSASSWPTPRSLPRKSPWSTAVLTAST